jgi:hypothetical protein
MNTSYSTGFSTFIQYYDGRMLVNEEHCLGVMNKAGECGGKTVLVPAGVPSRAEKDGSLIVVYTSNGADFPADKAGGAGDEEGFGN